MFEPAAHSSESAIGLTRPTEIAKDDVTPSGNGLGNGSGTEASGVLLPGEREAVCTSINELIETNVRQTVDAKKELHRLRSKGAPPEALAAAADFVSKVQDVTRQCQALRGDFQQGKLTPSQVGQAIREMNVRY